MYHIEHVISGLKATPFRGLLSIQQVECTGHDLTSDLDVLTLTLFSVPNNTILAYVNLKNNDCSTSSSYSACVINHEESKKSRLLTLVMDLEEEQTVWFGCNVSTFRSGIIGSVSWSISVTLNSRSFFCI